MIKVIAGKLLRDTEFIGKMDPFVIIEYQGTKYKTSVIQGGGKKPVWNDLFEIEVHSMGDELHIECYDEDIFVHDLIGIATLPVSLLCHVQALRKWFPLQYHKKKSGMILLETKYTPPLEQWPESKDSF